MEKKDSAKQKQFWLPLKYNQQCKSPYGHKPEAEKKGDDILACRQSSEAQPTLNLGNKLKSVSYIYCRYNRGYFLCQ
jgi:hypothetical protein